LSRITEFTKGRILLRGRVVSLLETATWKLAIVKRDELHRFLVL
jgi:hypothetical protein